MEKITLKPSVKELIYKNGEDNIHFDVLSYRGANGQEKMLGSLFILGHIKYSEENLAYAVNLISSLAKREYYSETSLQEQNAKSSFERTLKKLNEVLDDFFQNKNFKLNIGLAAISGENIYISRLGKFKVALARDGKYIDILNNIDLFSKDAEGEKQFSNIISGKIKPNDKIFAYFPSRSITSREKQLNEIFVKENQDGFSQKIAHLAANANNFSCCGVHIDVQKIKEIPISTTAYINPPFKTQTSSGRVSSDEDRKIKPIIQPKTQNMEQPGQTVTESNESQDGQDTQTPEISLETEQSRIIPAEFLVSKRANILTPLIISFQKLVSAGRLGERARRRGFIMLSVVILLPVLIFVLLRAGGGSTEDKNAIKQADENLKLAQSHINQSNPKDARSLLQASLASLIGISNKKAENAKKQINQTLDGLDHISNKQSALFADPTVQNQNFKANFIAAFGDHANTADADGVVSAITPNETIQLDQFKLIPQFIFGASSFVAVFNGSDTFGVYNPESKKTNTFSLKEPVPAADAILYENNLYVLSGNRIYKYSDATTGRTKRTDWGGDDTAGNQISIAIDGNVYALTDDGKLLQYFKGKKIGELDLRLIPSSGSRIFTFKDSAFLFLADKINKRVYIYDKTTGELKTTYKLDAVGSPQDISISPDGTVWILSADNKIWTIK